MKKNILALVAACAMAASTANAAGLNLFVNGCNGDATPTNALTNPCTSNTGSMSMVASYVAPAGISALSGIEVVIDVQTAATALSPWWDVNAGGCRENALQASYVIDAALAIRPASRHWQGADGIRRSRGVPRRRGWPEPRSHDHRLGRRTNEYAGTRRPASSTTRRTSRSRVRTRSTAMGCLDPACVVLNQINLAQPVGTAGGDQQVTAVAAGNFVGYQGGVVAGGCPGAVPTQNRTWGSVKSLYR